MSHYTGGNPREIILIDSTSASEEITPTLHLQEANESGINTNAQQEANSSEVVDHVVQNPETEEQPRGGYKSLRINARPPRSSSRRRGGSPAAAPRAQQPRRRRPSRALIMRADNHPDVIAETQAAANARNASVRGQPSHDEEASSSTRETSPPPPPSLYQNLRRGEYLYYGSSDSSDEWQY